MDFPVAPPILYRPNVAAILM
ncbi:MAG: hypothetical protein RL015_3902, partial [Verrucomicrobiota bacterium]